MALLLGCTLVFALLIRLSTPLRVVVLATAAPLLLTYVLFRKERFSLAIFLGAALSWGNLYAVSVGPVFWLAFETGVYENRLDIPLSIIYMPVWIPASAGVPPFDWYWELWLEPFE